MTLDYNKEYYPKLCFWKETVNTNKWNNISKYDFNLHHLLEDPTVIFVHFCLPGQILSLYFN